MTLGEQTLILAGGLRAKTAITKHISSSSLVIGADSGAEKALDMGIVPNLVVGDMDSISPKILEQLKELKVPLEIYPAEKDLTDTEIAIQAAYQRDYKDIVIAGAVGDRWDHSLANIFLLKKYADLGVNIRIIDDKNQIELINEYKRIEKDESFYSVIALADDGVVLSLKGFYYDLHRERLDFGSTRGLSNYIVEPFAEIFIESGFCLLVKSVD